MGAPLKDADTLRDFIVSAFPAEAYTGQVTAADGALTPELDDEEALFNALIGRRWTDVDRSLLEAQPDGYILLTDAAYRAFFPAWLMCALGEIDGENEVRDFVVYAFSHTAQQLRALNQEQRRAVRLILEYFNEHERNTFLQKRISEALENVAMLERDLIASPWLDRSR